MPAKKSVKVMVKVKPKPQQPKKGAPRPDRTRGTGLLSSLGALGGGLLGGPSGAALGSSAGSLISRITGFGDYKVSRNSISMGTSVPTFRSNKGGVVLCHREFLTDVSGSTGFALNDYEINPGLARSFPYLSSIAYNFEEYEFRGLVFEYRPSSGMAVSSTASSLGVVILATDYDVLNTTFTSKQQMESYEFATATIPFTECIHPVECARGSGVLDNLYTRVGAIPPNADQRMYDLGRFQIATSGMQSVYTVGELWVSYDIILKKPRLAPTLGVSYAHFVESPSGTAATATTFGTTGAYLNALTTLPGFLPGSTHSSVVCSIPGTYFMAVSAASGTATISSSPSFTRGANIAPVSYNWFVQNTLAYSAAFITTRAVELYNITVVTPGVGTANEITLSVSGLSAGFTDLFFFSAMPNAMFDPMRARCMKPGRPVPVNRDLTLECDEKSTDFSEVPVLVRFPK